ncbi:hypothetical protein [Emcibacter nanhaiensis]|uniref:hypothetical protein n=1 Tax=Emcibacter nanhaiensis TaxID=1505037 RepID=UPI0015E3C0E5|nr:hypothetical protein [Emcibacter nanhaiensis]
MELADGIIIALNSGTLLTVLRVAFLLGQYDQKHKSHSDKFTAHEKRLDRLESKIC